jgi:hypothetical protein
MLPRFALRTYASIVAFLVAVAAGSASRAATTAHLETFGARPAATLPAEISFEPQRWFYMLSSEYAHTGVLKYKAIAGAYPGKVPPSTGYLTCTGGYSVPLEVSSGPWVKGYIEDRYDVLPQSVEPPVPIKTILNCSSTWGLFTSAGTLLDSTTLYATIVYNTGDPAIAFSPSTIGLVSGAHASTGTLDYFYTAKDGVKPIPDPGGYLTCGNGASVPLHIASGPEVGDEIRDTYTVDPSGVHLAHGASTTCTSTWGSYLANGSLLGQATLSATLTGP